MHFPINTARLGRTIRENNLPEFLEDEDHLFLASSLPSNASEFEQELDSKHFPRVNRSAIVNMSKLIKLTPNSNGEYIAQLSTGDLIKVSRKYKFQLDELRP